MPILDYCHAAEHLADYCKLLPATLRVAVERSLFTMMWEGEVLWMIHEMKRSLPKVTDTPKSGNRSTSHEQSGPHGLCPLPRPRLAYRQWLGRRAVQTGGPSALQGQRDQMATARQPLRATHPSGSVPRRSASASIRLSLEADASFYRSPLSGSWSRRRSARKERVGWSNARFLAARQVCFNLDHKRRPSGRGVTGGTSRRACTDVLHGDLLALLPLTDNHVPLTVQGVAHVDAHPWPCRGDHCEGAQGVKPTRRFGRPRLAGDIVRPI